MALVRTLTIVVLMLLAIAILAMGLDVPIPHLPWRGHGAVEIPVGIVLIFAGLAVARFWTLPKDEEKLMQDWQRRRKPPR